MLSLPSKPLAAHHHHRLQAILPKKVRDRLVRERRILMKIDVVGRTRHEYMFQLRVGVDGRAGLVVDADTVSVADYVVRLAGDMLVWNVSQLAGTCSYGKLTRAGPEKAIGSGVKDANVKNSKTENGCLAASVNAAMAVS